MIQLLQTQDTSPFQSRNKQIEHNQTDRGKWMRGWYQKAKCVELIDLIQQILVMKILLSLVNNEVFNKLPKGGMLVSVRIFDPKEKDFPLKVF